MSNSVGDDDNLGEFPELVKVFETLGVQDEATSPAQPGRLPNGRPMAVPHRPRPRKPKPKPNTSQHSQPPTPIHQSSSFDFQPVPSAPSIPIFNPLATNQTGIPAFVPRPPTVPSFAPQPIQPIPSTQPSRNMMGPPPIPGIAPQPRAPGPTTQRPMDEGKPQHVPQPRFDDRNIPSLGIPLSSSPFTTSYTHYRNAESDLLPFQRDVQIALEGKKALKKELQLKEIELQNKMKELDEANIQVQGMNELEADIREQMREIERLKGVIMQRDEEIEKLRSIVEGRLEEDSDGDDGDDHMEMDDGGKGAAAKTKMLKLKQALTVCDGKREMLQDVVNEQAEKIVQMQEVIEGRQIPDFWAKMRDLQARAKALERRNQELEESSSESLEARIKELEAQLEEAKDEAAINLEDYETAKKMQDLLTNENKNLRAVIAQGEEKQSEWAKGRIERLEEQNGALKEELREKERNIEELEQQVSTLFLGQDHSAELQKKEEECQEKLAKLKSDYDAVLQMKALEIDGWKRHDQETGKSREVAARNLAQAQEEKSTAERNLQECKDENARLEGALATCTAQIEHLQQEFAQAQQTQQNIANSNLEALDVHMLQMTEAATQAVIERDAAIAQRDAYLSQIEQLNAEIQRLNTLGLNVEQQRNEAHNDRDQAIKGRDDMDGKFKTAMGEAANLQQQVVYLQNQLAAAQQQFPAENAGVLHAEINQLRQQLAEAQQGGQETAALQQEIVQQAGDAIEAQRGALAEELEEEKKKHRMAKAELADAKARVPGLESQVQELQSQLQAAKEKQLAVTTEDGKSMYNRLTMLENDNAELLMQQSRDKIQRETDEIRVSGFTKEIAQLQAQLAAANTLLNSNGQDALNQELINLHGEVQQLQAQLAEAQKYIPDAQKLPLCDQEVRRQRDLLAHREAEILHLRAHCQKLEKACHELESSRVHDDQLIAKKKKGGQPYGPHVVKELKDQIEKMEIQMAMSQGLEINKKNAEIERLRAEVMRAKAELLKQSTAKKSVEEVEAQRLFEENDELRKTIEELELELKFAPKESSDTGMGETPPRPNQNQGETHSGDVSMGDSPPRADRSSEVGELQQEVNGLHVRIEELTAQLGEKKQELEEKDKTYEQEYARFNQVHAELSRKVSQISGDATTTEQVNQMQQAVQTLTVELETAKKELEEKKRKADFEESKNRALVEMNKQLKGDIKIAKEEAEKEKSKGIDFDSRLPQLQQEALDPTRNPALAEATRKNEELQKQVDEALAVKNAYEELEKQMPGLKTAYEDKINEIAALEKRLADCHEHGKKLEADLKTANDMLLKAREAALDGNGHVEVVADLENKLAVLQTELEAEKNKLPPLPDSDDGSEGVSILKETLEDCYEQGKKLGDELNAKTAELESVRAALTTTQRELETASSNDTRLQAHLEQLQLQLQEKTRDYSRVVKQEGEVNRALTDAVMRLTYVRSFPHGHIRLPTSADGLLCGLFAIIESIKAQMPHLPVPELSDLQRIIGTVTDDCNNFQAEHLHLTLRQWAEEQHMQQSLQLGIITPETGYLVMREEGRDTLWLHNDEAIKLQNAGFNHYEGLAAKPCDAPVVDADDAHVLAQRTQERDVAMAQAEQQSRAIKTAEARLANLAAQDKECRVEIAALRQLVDTCQNEKTELEAKMAELVKQLTEQESKCEAEKTSLRQMVDTCQNEKTELEAKIAELQTVLGQTKEPGKDETDSTSESRSRAPSPEISQETTDAQDQSQTEHTREGRSREPSPDLGSATETEPDSSSQIQEAPVDVHPSVEITNDSSDDTMEVDLPDYQSTPEKNTSNESPANPFGAKPSGTHYSGTSNPFGGSNAFGGSNPFGTGKPSGGSIFDAFPGTSTGVPQQPSFNFFQKPPPPTSQPHPPGRATRGAHGHTRSGGRGGRPTAADFWGPGAGTNEPPSTTFGNVSGSSSFFGNFGTAFNSNPSGNPSNMQQQISDLNNQLFNARAERKRLEQERNHFERLWREEKQGAWELNMKVRRVAEMGEEQKAEFEEEKVRMVTQHEETMAKLNARVGQLELEKAKLEVEVTKLTEKTAEQGAEHEKFLKMLKKGDGSKTTKFLSDMNARLEKKLIVQEELYKEQEESLDECLEEIEELKEEVTTKEAEIEKLTESESMSAAALADLQAEYQQLKEEAEVLKTYQGYKNAWIKQNEQIQIVHEDVRRLKNTLAKKEEEYNWASERMTRLKEENDYNEQLVKQLGDQTSKWAALIDDRNIKMDSLMMQLERARAGERPNNGKAVDDMDDDGLYAVEKVHKLEKLIERLLSYRFQRQFMTDVFDKIYEQIKADQPKGIPASKKHLQELVVEEWLRQMSTILPPSEPNIPGWARTEDLVDGVVVDEEGEDPQSAEARNMHEQKLQGCGEENLVQRLKQEIQRLRAKLEDHNTASETTKVARKEQQGDSTELNEKLRVKDDEIAGLKTKLAEALAAPTTLQDLHAVARQILDRVNGSEVNSTLATKEDNAAEHANREGECPCCDCCKCKTGGILVEGEKGAAVPENIVNDLQCTVDELSRMMHDTVKDFQTEVETVKTQFPGADATQSNNVVSQLQKELRQAKDMIDNLKLDLANAQVMLESGGVNGAKSVAVSVKSLDLTDRLVEAQQHIRDLQARVDDGKSAHPELYKDQGRAEILQQQVDYLQKELDKLKHEITQERETLQQQVLHQREQFDTKLDQEREKVADLRMQLVAAKATRHVGRRAATGSEEHQVVPARSFGRRALAVLCIAMAITGWFVYLGMEASAALRAGVGSIYYYGRAQTHQVLVFENWEMFGLFELWQSYVCYCVWRLAFAILG